jgi:hypothetical protein
MAFSKYIVPIYIKEDNVYNYYGTGFIVNGMLITANHVVKDKINTYFLYKNKIHYVDITRLVALESTGKILSSNHEYDLFVCKTDIMDSDLKLSPQYDKNQSCELCAYVLDKGVENGKESICEDQYSDVYINRDIAIDSIGRRLCNCFSCNHKFKHTNSGGPLLQNGYIVGMLIKGIRHLGKYNEGIFIKANHIKQAIEKKNINNIH